MISVEYHEFTARGEDQARRIVERVLSTYGGSALKNLSITSVSTATSFTHMAFLFMDLTFRGNWASRLHRVGEPREWVWTQSCPYCGGGARWTPMGPEEGQSCLSCGGCGLALASPNSGLDALVDWSKPEDFPRQELDFQLTDNGYEPLRATLEASELVGLVQKLLIGAEDTTYWSEPMRLEVLAAGDFTSL